MSGSIPVDDVPPFVERRDDGITLRVKAVPGASRDAVAGVLGDRLKVRIAAPPEGGRANEAIRRLLATTFGVARSAVTLGSGAASRDKTFEIDGDAATLVERAATLTGDR